MPPLSQEFLHHLHELMVETSHGLRDELNTYKNRVVWEAQKRGNSAGVPVAYSDAAIHAYRTRIQATIKSYLDALEICGITVDAAVEREMLQQITLLTAAPKHLSLPPGITGPTVAAVQAEHGRKMERAASDLRREAANRLRELKMKASRTVPAVQPMTPSQPFTIASVAPTLAALKALPVQEQATLLLRRLAYLFPQVKSTGGFSKHNILLSGDTTGIAYGFVDNEKMRVLEHLLGMPWTRLVNDGYLVDLRDSKFFVVTDEGLAAAAEAAMPKQVIPEPAPIEERKLIPFQHSDRPVAFMSYSWETKEHEDWVLALATRLTETGGVNVILDKWHLRMGMDKTLFMEKAVAESNFVLVICTPTYAKKANERRGGVGYEAMIITGELAQDIQQTKFIPVLREGEWDKTSMPRWLSTRTGADLRGTPFNERQYDMLVRELHNEYLKPPAPGPKPHFSAATHAPSTPSDSHASVPEVQSTQATDEPPRPQNAIAYAFYETKGPDAQRFKMYIRPVDSANDVFSLETSDGERTQGTFYTVGRDFVRFDRQYVSRGYIRTHKFNGTGRRDIDIP